MPHDASKPIRAIVSLVTSKSFIIGAEVLAHSLRRLQVKVELILLVTENVAELCSNGCGFDRVVTVDSIPNPNSSHVNTWVSCGFTKLRIWQLDVLLGINQVLYIDADCAVLEDVGSLFTLLDCVDFAAAPDFFPPDRFNAGVLLIKTCSEQFIQMLNQVSVMGSYDGGDTGFLNFFFPNWYHGPAEMRLPFGYNAQRAMRMFTRQRPEYWLNVPISILHYSSSPKPWERDIVSGQSSLFSPHDDPGLIFSVLLEQMRLSRDSRCVELVDARSKQGMTSNCRSPVLPVDFADAAAPCSVKFGLYSKSDHVYLSNFAFVYNKMALSSISCGRIPKIIHQIWLGDANNISESCLHWSKSLQKLHYNFEYRLWTDNDVAELRLHRRLEYDQATTLVQRVDILRWEILYMFGGVYLDLDMQCLAKLDQLLARYSFFIGLGSTGYVEVMNSVIGCSARHPLALHVIDSLQMSPCKTGSDVMNSTGPGMITCVIGQCDPGFMLQHSAVVLPSAVFYPLPNSMRFLVSDADKDAFVQPCSFAIHHWLSSWQSPLNSCSDPVDFCHLIQTLTAEEAISDSDILSNIASFLGQ